MKTPLRLGLYVVTEPDCFNPKSGASQHIQIGIKELNRYFEIETYFPNKTRNQSNQRKKAHKKTSYSVSTLFLGGLKGSIKDILTLCNKIRDAFLYFNYIKTREPDFVYIRASFLDPLPLLLKIGDIPCFIEANGIQFESMSKYYISYLKPINKWIERIIYSSAKYIFFVGSYGDYWKLNENIWTNVENGVEYEFIDKFDGHKKVIEKNINIAFIAKLMSHHKAEILVEALKKLDLTARSRFSLHLIGSGMEKLKSDLQNYIEIVEPGFLDREDLILYLKKIHIGVIPGGPQYNSQMKLFDYGAAKCLVLAPRLHNLQYWFNDSEIEFFEVNNPLSLAKCFERLIIEDEATLQKGECLYQRIKNDFTWEKIFERKAKLIQQKIDMK